MMPNKLESVRMWMTDIQMACWRTTCRKASDEAARLTCSTSPTTVASLITTSAVDLVSSQTASRAITTSDWIQTAGDIKATSGSAGGTTARRDRAVILDSSKFSSSSSGSETSRRSGSTPTTCLARTCGCSDEPFCGSASAELSIATRRPLSSTTCETLWSSSLATSSLLFPTTSHASSKHSCTSTRAGSWSAKSDSNLVSSRNSLTSPSCF